MAVTLKVATLVIKALVKPLANSLKASAAEPGTFRDMCHRYGTSIFLFFYFVCLFVVHVYRRNTLISDNVFISCQSATTTTSHDINLPSVGQFHNKMMMQIQLRSQGHRVLNVKPLPEDEAAKLGAEVFAEGLVLFVGVSAIGVEVVRKSRADEQAARDKQIKEIQEKEAKELRAVQREEILRERFRQLEDRILTVEGAKLTQVQGELMGLIKETLNLSESMLLRIERLEQRLGVKRQEILTQIPNDTGSEYKGEGRRSGVPQSSNGLSGMGDQAVMNVAMSTVNNILGIQDQVGSITDTNGNSGHNHSLNSNNTSTISSSNNINCNRPAHGVDSYTNSDDGERIRQRANHLAACAAGIATILQDDDVNDDAQENSDDNKDKVGSVTSSPTSIQSSPSSIPSSMSPSSIPSSALSPQHIRTNSNPEKNEKKGGNYCKNVDGNDDIHISTLPVFINTASQLAARLAAITAENPHLQQHQRQQQYLQRPHPSLPVGFLPSESQRINTKDNATIYNLTSDKS